MPRRQIYGLLILLALIPAAAWSQGSEASWDNLRQLNAGDKVTIVTQKLAYHFARFTTVTDEAITFKEKKEEKTLRREEVLRVTTPIQGRRAIHAAIGFAAGFALGYGISSAITHGDDEETIHAMTGMLGGGIGAGAGAALPGTRTLYRAQKRTP